jgi:D-alanyl-lipoteichoic acid acyltransferase DltB (MBOAT superfamily)
MHSSTLKIILPVGISFYTFQTLSYTIDIYKKKLPASKSFVNFATYVAFFPQLVAGPIERAGRLLPQFSRKRTFTFEQGKSGLYLIIWGLFKKVVVADNCAYFVNQIFENHTAYSAGELWVGAVLFAFQIYGDFSGYSDIAIGTARLFGFDLMTNFKFPYFSKNIGDFWRRWHISLSTWFRDYVYIPLGGSKGNVMKQLRNVLIIFVVSGFWHGANWTFIVWGAFHALLFIPLLLARRNRRDIDTTKVSLVDIGRIILTFILVTVGWIYFRADSIGIANDYIISIISGDFFEFSLFTKTNKNLLFLVICVFSVISMLLFEIKAYLKAHSEVRLNMMTGVFIVLCIFLMGAFKDPAQFIYFQF